MISLPPEPNNYGENQNAPIAGVGDATISLNELTEVINCNVSQSLQTQGRHF